MRLFNAKPTPRDSCPTSRSPLLASCQLFLVLRGGLAGHWANGNKKGPDTLLWQSRNRHVCIGSASSLVLCLVYATYDSGQDVRGFSLPRARYTAGPSQKLGRTQHSTSWRRLKFGKLLTAGSFCGVLWRCKCSGQAQHIRALGYSLCSPRPAPQAGPARDTKASNLSETHRRLTINHRFPNLNDGRCECKLPRRGLGQDVPFATRFECKCLIPQDHLHPNHQSRSLVPTSHLRE